MDTQPSAFQDHFSGHATDYARSRPTYPPDLFRCLAALAPARDATWDCGTGNGQCALGLAVHFASVIATDANAEQIREATPHPRVAKPGAVLAAWSYGLITISPAVDAVVLGIYRETDADWPPERAHVDDGYRSLDFPFTPIPAPEFAMRQEWTLAEVAAYLGTWSGVRRYSSRTGTDPVAAASGALAVAWGGDPKSRRAVHWRLSLRVGRIG